MNKRIAKVNMGSASHHNEPEEVHFFCESCGEHLTEDNSRAWPDYFHFNIFRWRSKWIECYACGHWTRTHGQPVPWMPQDNAALGMQFFVARVVDYNAHQPKTEFQKGVGAVAQIVGNLLFGAMAVAVMNAYLVANNPRPREVFGLLIPVEIGRIVAYLGLLLALTAVCLMIVQLLSRFQIFVLLGVANLASALTEWFPKLMDAAKAKNTEAVHKAAFSMLRSLLP